MAYRLSDNTERIISQEQNGAGLGIRFMLDAIHRESRPKTPQLTGQLRGDVAKRVVDKKGSIKWGKKYAWYQERGYTSGKVRRYTTPGTGAHFAENAVKTVTKDGRKYFKMAGL